MASRVLLANGGAMRCDLDVDHAVNTVTLALASGPLQPLQLDGIAGYVYPLHVVAIVEED